LSLRRQLGPIIPQVHFPTPAAVDDTPNPEWNVGEVILTPEVQQLFADF